MEMFMSVLDKEKKRASHSNEQNHIDRMENFLILRKNNLKMQLIAVMGTLVMITALSIYFYFVKDANYINKNILQADIANIISNDGDLRSIKKAMSDQAHPSVYETEINKSQFYPSNISLSVVLDDIRVDFFREVTKESKLPKLDAIIKEFEETNPFDKLQIGQKDFFENIRIKTEGEGYLKISNDVNNIVEELYQKNQLVNEYLSDSKLSFWISILAVIISIIIGIIQIKSNKHREMKNTLQIILEKMSENKVDQREGK